MNAFRAVISYDGTCYFGWQTTRVGPSIQEALASALLNATQEKAIPEAASRTDRGVHAEGQVVSFSLKKDWDPYRLTRALNAHLPKDIRVLSIENVPLDFHPTLQAKQKEYHYRISNCPFQLPIHGLYTWHFHSPINVDLMQEASRKLEGKHDFTAFANEKEKNPICTIHSIGFDWLDPVRLQISLQGDRFLYKMARNLAGTLLYIGSGKLAPDCIVSLLQSKDRKKAGVTAPAHGLFLHRVIY